MLYDCRCGSRHVDFHTAGDPIRWSVRCGVCGRTTGFFASSKDGAEAEWNRPIALERLLERAVTQLQALPDGHDCPLQMELTDNLLSDIRKIGVVAGDDD